MAWRRPGDKPVSVPMMVCLPTYICVTRPQWVKMQHSARCAIHCTMIFLIKPYTKIADICISWGLFKMMDASQQGRSHDKSSFHNESVVCAILHLLWWSVYLVPCILTDTTTFPVEASPINGGFVGDSQHVYLIAKLVYAKSLGTSCPVTPHVVETFEYKSISCTISLPTNLSDLCGVDVFHSVFQTLKWCIHSFTQMSKLLCQNKIIT